MRFYFVAMCFKWNGLSKEWKHGRVKCVTRCLHIEDALRITMSWTVGKSTSMYTQQKDVEYLCESKDIFCTAIGLHDAVTSHL